MKKQILIFIATIFISFSYSQSFKLYYEGQPLDQNAEITITSHPDSGMMVLDTLDVKNISSVTSEVFCVRTIVENVGGTVNSFCWGLCYPPSTDTSAVAVTILPQQTSYIFTGDHYPNGHSGVVKVKYTFYDSHNSSNQATVMVNYDASITGNTKNLKPEYTLLEAYPNPANTWVSFDYDFSDIKNGSIVIYNLLGTPIEKIDVSGKSGVAKINTASFSEGIYFYSLVIDNKVIRTQKLMVRH